MVQVIVALNIYTNILVILIEQLFGQQLLFSLNFDEHSPSMSALIL